MCVLGRRRYVTSQSTSATLRFNRCISHRNTNRQPAMTMMKILEVACRPATSLAHAGAGSHSSGTKGLSTRRRHTQGTSPISTHYSVLRQGIAARPSVGLVETSASEKLCGAGWLMEGTIVAR